MGLRDNLSNDPVTALRVRDPLTVGPSQTIREAIYSMRHRREGCVIVTEHGKPTGIFTERDVLSKILLKGVADNTPIAEVMTQPPMVIREDCVVADVIRTMHRGGFRHMPIVDKAGYLTGLVSVRQVVEYIVEHYPSAVFNLPPEPMQKQLAREGA
jgi:CBS domain-containing protein